MVYKLAFEKKRNVSEHPPFREEDVGHPLPDSEYAVSVSLPTWDSVIGYEESQDSVLEKLKTGYPRFFLSPIIKSLENRVLSEFNVSEDFGCLIFNLESVAVRCREFILNRHDGWEVVVKPICQGNAFTVIFPKQVQDVAKKFWRFFGEGLSVRCAKSLLAENYKVDPRGNDALLAIKNRIAEDTGQSAEDVYIYPSGMAAVSAVHRALTHIAPGARSIQFDFPYVDVLKVQKEIGSGVVFLPAADEQSISRLDDIVNNGEKICGIYCELPSNPLLRSADLNSIKRITGSLNIPIVVDDTVATNVNVDVFKYADVATTSLTKYYSGVGDVIAGAVIVNRESQHRDKIVSQLKTQNDSTLYAEDAIALNNNMIDYRERVLRVNQTAPRLVDLLNNHHSVSKIWYPKYETRTHYDAVKRDEGGFSGLFSIELKNPEKTTSQFYNALQLCKGPSLGANFTLVCPYTILAHYDELQWCHENGVSKWLIRVSVGQETYDFLSQRFLDALEAVD